MHVRDYQVFTWLKAESLISDQQLDCFFDALNPNQAGDSLRCSVLGAEVHCLDSSSGVDLSILYELRDGLLPDEQSAPGSAVERLITDSVRTCLASAVWLEYDHPYASIPLVYFSLTSSLASADALVEAYPKFVALLSCWLKEQPLGGSAFDCPSQEEFSAWIHRLPCSCEIQQLGFSFRSESVQPRILVTLDQAWACLSEITSHEVSELLEPCCRAGQLLFASAYPYALSQYCGIEVVNDQLSVVSLRTLQHPPRLRGTRLLKLIHRLASTYGQRWSIPLAWLSTLERRHTGEVDGQQSQEVVVSGVSHLKIVLRAGAIDGLKIYGGTVSNVLKFESM